MPFSFKNFTVQAKNYWSAFKQRLSRRADNRSLTKNHNGHDRRLVLNLNKKKHPTWRQLSCLKHILSPAEKNITRSLSAIIAASLLILGVQAYYKHRQLAPDYGGEYIEGLAGSINYINPLLAPLNNVDADISRLVFSGLLKYNKNLELVPDLASSFEINEDQKVYTFFLRKDVKWHDNEKFTANDVIFTIQSMQDPNFKSPLYYSFQNVQLEMPDDYTVKFILDKPYAPFLTLLTTGIIPQHLWVDIPPMNANLALLNTAPVGTGPFKFSEAEKNKLGFIKSYRLARNEDYYNKKPYLEKISFRLYPNAEEMINNTEPDKVQGFSFTPQEIKNKNFNQYSFILPQYTAIFFNQGKNESLKNKKIREALGMAIDQQKIINTVLDGQGAPVANPILPGFVGSDPKNQSFEYQPVKAAALLEEAGFAKKEGEPYRKKGDKILEITLTTVDFPERKQAADVIQKFWEAIGVKTQIELLSSKDIQKIIKTKDYQAFLYGQMVGADPDPFPFWHSSQTAENGFNLALFAHSDADKAIDAARRTNNVEERAKQYKEFQRIIAEELPALFLYQPNYLYLLDKKIKGIGLQRLFTPADRFIDIESWYAREKRTWK